MRWFACFALIFLGTGEAVSGPRQQFPYEATVEGRDAFARSGPGRNYYPTARLKPGATVTVHRHDPGGWYMIAPPPSSFSWIRASYVNPTSPGQGVLTTNDVVVRIGSLFGDDRDVEQVRLSKGDTVHIIGEQTFQTRNGALHLYKIDPPRGEYRWVRGQHLVAKNATARKVNDRDPYATPSFAVRETKRVGTEISHPSTGGGPTLGNPKGHDGPSLSGGNSTGGSLESERLQLADLDKRFRAMCRQDTASWDFTQLRSEYRTLRKTATDPAITRQIDRRMPTLRHYCSVKAEYDKLIQLTAETQRRDAELAGMPATHAIAMSPQPGTPPYHSSGPQGPTLAPPQPEQTPDYQAPAPVPTPLPVPQGSFQPPVRRPQRRAMRRQFDGAGIIKRVRQVRPGLPRYAIVAPDGRFLSYLQPVRGLSLEQHVGRAMGVYGQRIHRRDLGSDFITVTAMQPVRLRP